MNPERGMIMFQFQTLVRGHGLNAGKVALLVGTVLVIINQHNAIFGNETFRMLPALVTYFVPFIVFLLGKREERGAC